MNRVKRWLLLLAAVVVILPNVQALRATSLIFGRSPNVTKSSSTTSTTEAAVPDDNEEVPADQSEGGEEEVTKPPLTGIPQIDYVWDPNLPRELNGFNLSSYPFLNGVPDLEDIDFKCDGLHDGFYASIKFGCQLYHHCIYGIRHDFLCANFTAFDQKTFICHFVSEVNCKNSAKYWFRNDALYRATTTTTTSTTTIAPPPTTTTERPRRPVGRKPLRRRRPQNDYYYEDEEYDDYVVEERPNRRRKPAVRNRYRPMYDDEYPENERGYEDEEPLEDDYDYQPRNRNRPSNNRRYRNRERNNRRNLNEQRSSSRSQDDEPRSVTDAGQSEPTKRSNFNRDRRPVQDERERVRERDRNRYVTNNSNSKRPLRNDDEEEVDIEYERPRANYDEAEEELPRRNNFRNTQTEKRVKGRTTPTVNRDEFDDPPLAPRRKNNREEIREEELPKVRPSSNGASVFNRPRTPPKISRPVPLNEKQKYDYKKSETPSATNEKDDYYDEYEDELPPQKAPSKSEVRPQAQHKSRTIVAPPNRNFRPSVKEEIPKEDIIDEEYEDDEVIEPERSPAVKPISKTDTQTTRNFATDQEIETQPRRNTNDNNNRSPIPSGPSIFQTEQQLKNRDKFRNSFRTQSRQPIEDTPKEPVPVSVDDRGRNNKQQNARQKLRNNYRSNVKDQRSSIIQAPTAAEEDIDNTSKEVAQKPPAYSPYKPLTSRLPPTAKDVSLQVDIEPPLIDETPRGELTYKNQQLPPSATDSLNEEIEVRPAVRVVKRPFLPSRGGNPYLPRGLRPVGSSEEETYTTTSSNEQLNDNSRQHEEHIPPQSTRNYDQRQHFPGPLTTQPPQVDPPKDPLDHIYSEYDVTLNDALNPTLKPLVTSRGSPIGFSLNTKYDQQQFSYVPLNTATAQSRSSVVHVPYDDGKFKTYVDEFGLWIFG